MTVFFIGTATLGLKTAILTKCADYVKIPAAVLKSNREIYELIENVLVVSVSKHAWDVDGSDNLLLTCCCLITQNPYIWAC